MPLPAKVIRTRMLFFLSCPCETALIMGKGVVKRTTITMNIPSQNICFTKRGTAPQLSVASVMIEN